MQVAELRTYERQTATNYDSSRYRTARKVENVKKRARGQNGRYSVSNVILLAYRDTANCARGYYART
eukprot:6177630-Pleurochrysis_carterae.AAC.2